jgi:very-short-patch-repair endonuclease
MELGYSVQMLRTMVNRSRLHRIHRAVYAVGHTRLTAHGRWTAAVLACGSGAVLSHLEAAALHDLRRIGGGAINVTAPGRHNIQGVRCHSVRHHHEDDITVADCIPVTTIARTVLDLAEVLTSQRLNEALEQAERMDVFDLRAIDAVIARNPGRRGITPLRKAIAKLADHTGWTQSGLERYFVELARAHGLPIPLTNQYVEGELVDAYWPDQRVVVEVDSWLWHKTRRSFESDRARDAKLTALGYRVVRFTDIRLRDEPEAVAAELRALLSEAPARRRATAGR